MKNNKKSKSVGDNAMYNIFKMVHVPTGTVYYNKGIVDQCPDADRFLQKNYRMAQTHKTPGNMLRQMRDTLKSEWGVQIVRTNVSKSEANNVKRALIESDKECESVFMSK